MGHIFQRIKLRFCDSTPGAYDGPCSVYGGRMSVKLQLHMITEITGEETTIDKKGTCMGVNLFAEGKLRKRTLRHSGTKPDAWSSWALGVKERRRSNR